MCKRRRIGDFVAPQPENIAMSAAVSLPVLIGIFGVATFFANLFPDPERELQSAVDGAVVFAAKQYGIAGTSDDKIRAVVPRLPR